MIQGYDVAGYQAAEFPLTDTVNGRPVDFAIIKVTEGTGFTNTRWTQQRQWARDHGLSVGFYHFLHKGDTVRQADFFLSRMALAPGEHLWCDWETNPADGTHPPESEKNQWITYVQQQRPGHRVGLYCNTSFWKTLDTSGFAGDGLWIATGGYAAGSPPVSAPWIIHQYSTADGIDHDVAQFSSRAAMTAWAGGEDDVTLSDADKAWIKATVKEVVYQTDGILAAPPDASDYDPDPASPDHYWRGDTHVTAQTTAARAAVRAGAEILAQARANGAALTEIKNTLAALDLSSLPDAVAGKLAGLRIKLEES
jgi:hypothetical protein